MDSTSKVESICLVNRYHPVYSVIVSFNMNGKQILRAPFRILLSLIKSIIDFIYPPFCIVCSAHLLNDERLICEKCWLSLPKVNEDSNIAYEIKLKLGQEIHFSQAISIWEFSPPLQTAIHYLKYQGFKTLANQFGIFMAERLRQISLPADQTILVPVPLHKTRLRERGYNQSALLCKVIAPKTGLTYDDTILTRIRYTESQTKLSAVDRAKNVENAFKIIQPEKIQQKLIILVDDVITTGSTMNACARELMKNGAKAVFLFSIVKA